MGLTHQNSVGAKRIDNPLIDTKATINTNTYGIGGRSMDINEQNNNKTIRPNSQQHQQFQPSQQYGLGLNSQYRQEDKMEV